jgi:hypothetical protein
MRQKSTEIHSAGKVPDYKAKKYLKRRMQIFALFVHISKN